jgi:hypothetical protein
MTIVPMPWLICSAVTSFGEAYITFFLRLYGIYNSIKDGNGPRGFLERRAVDSVLSITLFGRCYAR